MVVIGSRHRIFEDPIPLGKDQVRRDRHTAPFVPLGQQGEEHLHLVPVVLDVADIVQDHTGEPVQLRQHVGQAQVPLRR
jgi:hypothetical protein